MKSEHLALASGTKEMEFPFLGISKDSETIVLFSGDGEGTIVYALPNTEDSSDLGKFSDCWDMEEFTPIIGKVILSN